MADLTAAESRQANFYSDARTFARMIMDGYNGLKSLQPESTYQDYTNTLIDGAGDNLGLVKGDVIAAVFTTANAMSTFLDAGHGSNLTKLR